MFRKRIKKSYPPGTFIPTPARVFAILQLCIAFSMLLWHSSQPFMGDLFRIKSKMLIYQHVLEHPLFATLAPQEQTTIANNYASLQSQLGDPFTLKLRHSFAAIFWGIPPLELTWIIFSIVLSIMLLKRVDGAALGLWLLPVLVLAYAVDNRLNYTLKERTDDEKLFPTETFLINNFLNQPLNGTLFEQQTQLKKAWDAYLVQTWTHNSGTPEEGFFYFNKARLKALPLSSHTSGPERDSLAVLALYLFWNLSYAVLGFRIRYSHAIKE